MSVSRSRNPQAKTKNRKTETMGRWLSSWFPFGTKGVASKRESFKNPKETRLSPPKGKEAALVYFRGFLWIGLSLKGAQTDGSAFSLTQMGGGCKIRQRALLASQVMTRSL